jgi:quinolinate synthase
MRSLENMEHVVTLEKPVRVKARSALDAMLAVR